MKSWIYTAVLTIIFAYGVKCDERKNETAQSLGPLNVHRENVTLSGFSSGGGFAQILQVSYSSLFKGVAVFSQTYYRCGPPEGEIDEFDKYCTTLFNLTNSELYNASKVHDDIKEYFAKGLIDDPKNLKDKRLYVYAGLRNLLFTPTQSLKILQVFEPYIQNPEAIRTHVQDAVQLVPSNKFGGPCTEPAEADDFIGNCGFSGATEAINFILFDNANATEAYQVNNVTRGNLTTFDQTEFTKDIANHNMDDIGFVYIPKKCQTNETTTEEKKCHLHFYFHGCLTGNEFNGPRHAENSGFLEVAETKGIIVVFPQAKSSVPNPIGCWDTYGVAGKNYATQQGAQVMVMKRMLDKILGPVVVPTEAMTTTTMMPEESTKSVAASSRISAARTSLPPKGYPKTLKAPPRKLTYLPPPPTVLSAPGALRRGAYKVVKYTHTMY